ncbi:MAG: hypothetical protein QOJ53_2436 [Sphingomonadales bacterium]|jgi:hypothetical protein|nr:hypothetical protein [Sphingomonadales bacterium]MEA3048104.1 hypothetical protein [Sphingomonadales bacterium]
MALLSISKAWEETADFARREARLLFPVAFLLMSLPGSILQAMAPVTTPGKAPEAGLWLLFVPVAVVSSLIGGLAISYLALRPGASVGEALQIGLRRVLVLLGAALLVGIAAAVLMIPLILIIALLAAPGVVPPALAVIPILLMIPVLLLFWVRLILITPAAAAESIGPVALIRRSWQLTRGHYWRLLGFLLLVILVSLVVLMAVGAIGGILVYLVAGQPQPGSIAMFLVLLISALVQAVVSGLFTACIARIYAQLAGTGDQDVFA